MFRLSACVCRFYAPESDGFKSEYQCACARVCVSVLKLTMKCLDEALDLQDGAFKASFL